MAPKNKQWITKMDGLDKLELVEGEVPAPKEGEVLVKIHAVSLNYRDIEVCTGQFTHLQSLNTTSSSGIIPCSDMCGTVTESKSPLLEPGARVMSIFFQSHLSGALKEQDLASGLGFPLPGVLAQYRCFAAESLVRAPGYLTNEEASCLPIASLTAWMALNWMRPLGEPLVDLAGAQTVLLQGTGGVSIAGLQIAKAAGLKAIITSSSDEKLKRAKEELGADYGINYRTYWEWQGPVMEATQGKGADMILETGGAKTLRKSFASVAFGGMINCIGYLSGKDDNDDEDGGGKKAEEQQQQQQLNRLNVSVLALTRNVTLKGLMNGGRDRFEDMARFYEDKEIRPVVCKTFKMEEAREAMGYLEAGKHFGKVVITVD